jgi:hypothetical protein
VLADDELALELQTDATGEIDADVHAKGLPRGCQERYGGHLLLYGARKEVTRWQR